MTIAALGLAAEEAGETGEAASELAPELVLVVMGLLLIAALVSIQVRRLHVPFTTLLVLLGMGLGILAQQPQFSFLRDLRLTPGLVFFVFVPGLLFEAAFNIDSRRLVRNLGPILTLAIPALAVSSAVVGAFLHFGGGLPLAVALVFGALISATDPVAVLAIFKELGAPKRLAMLVDGESLFNDGTSVVLFRILLGVALAGTVGWSAVANGAVEFVQVFGGGVLVGLGLGWLGAQMLARVWRDHYVETTLSLVLAYGSFSLAEHVIGVSGVMATVVAGLTLGNYGRTKISPSVLPHLEEFWEYLAFVVNALLFLLVGISVDLGGLLANAGLVALAIAAVLVARALAVFGLLPLLNRFLRDPVERSYQIVLYWGGLRGALALALALSLPDTFAAKPLLVSLTFGVVLFTLLVGSPTIGPLLRRLGLMQNTPSEVFETQSALVMLDQAVRRRLTAMRSDGTVSAKVADELEQEYAAREQQLRDRLAQTPADAIGADAAERLLRRHCLLSERRAAARLFAEGDISETTLHDLQHRLDLELSYLRWGPEAAAGVAMGPGSGPYVAPRSLQLPRPVLKLLGRVPMLRRLLERRRTLRLIRRYESERGRWLTIGAAVHDLETFGVVGPEVIAKVKEDYQGRRRAVGARLDAMADQFPEYVEDVQRTVALRFSLRTEESVLDELHELGLLSERFLQEHTELIDARLRLLGERPVPGVLVDPKEALRRVPVFASLPDSMVERLADLFATETFWEGEVVIRQGEPAEAVYLVGRGLLDVQRQGKSGKPERVATTRAGGFFGEMVFLDRQPYQVTIVTATPCTLLRLATADLERLLRTDPEVEAAIEHAYREHAAEIRPSLGLRQYPRVPLRGAEAATIQAYRLNADTSAADEQLDGEVLDLSLGGLGLGTREPVPAGTRLQVQFPSANDDAAAATGRIVSLQGTVQSPQADGGSAGDGTLHQHGVAFDDAPSLLAARFLRGHSSAEDPG